MATRATLVDCASAMLARARLRARMTSPIRRMGTSVRMAGGSLADERCHEEPAAWVSHGSSRSLGPRYFGSGSDVRLRRYCCSKRWISLYLACSEKLAAWVEHRATAQKIDR